MSSLTLSGVVCVVADHAGAAGHGRDIADRLLRRVRGGCVRCGGIGRPPPVAADGEVLGLRLRQLRQARAKPAAAFVAPIVALQANSM